MPAPDIGEHRRAILAELGIDTAAIERLAAEGLLRLPASP
jgi:crotonobetainyl-CoA:carnitine CoA-transferase CaiB-like acyl-CoA transferase